MEVGVTSVIEPESDGKPEEGRSVTMTIAVSVPAFIEPYFLARIWLAVAERTVTTY